MNKPHKHAEVIKAWADGAPIQTKSATGEWIDFDNPSPSWAAAEYRVKPDLPVKVYPETQMSALELYQAWQGCELGSEIRAVANAALRHAIDTGQVDIATVKEP